MPNDSALRSFLAELSPEDITTLVGRLSRLMPQGAAVYSPELNAGEAEWIAEQRMKRGLAQERERAILEQLLPQAMARQRAMIPESQADVFVPTRPRVMRESPFIATQPRPMPEAGIMGRKREYAGGGPVLGDQTMPDVSDSGQMFMDPMPFAGGGKVLGKNLDQMQAELMSKQGLSRRSLFGLPTQSQQYPLSKVEQEVQRIEQQARKKGEAPAVSTTRVDVDPGTGSKRSIMESLVETPVSRRTVLKTAGSQAMQSMLPVGDMIKAAGIANPVSTAVNVAKEAAPVMPLVPMTLQGVIARAARMGLDEDQTVALLKKMNMADEDDVLYMLSPMRNPYDFYEDLGEEAMTPLKAMANLINEDAAKPMAMRGPLREIKRENPAMFKELKQASRDIAEYGLE